MLMTPERAVDEAHTLRRTLKCYALRYYLTGRDQDALVEQTIAALAADPDAILDQPVERAIAEAMHRIFLRNSGLALKQQRPPPQSGSPNSSAV